MRTIAIANPKGGCGKTTTVVNLAAGLAAIGKRVLVVDLDPQAHATLALGLDPETQRKTVHHCLVEASVSISKLAQGTSIDGVDLAPSNILLANAEYELAADPRRGLILADQLGRLDSQYDICMIDCPPSLGVLTVNALVASTDIIAPVQLHSYALETLKQLLWAVELIRERFPDCRMTRLGLLLTFVESTPSSQEIQQQMREFFGDFVLETVIHRSISLAEAPGADQSIITYAPEGTPAANYRALAEELTDPESQKKHSLVEEHHLPPSTDRPEESELTAALTDLLKTPRRISLKTMKTKIRLALGIAIFVAIVLALIATMMVNHPPVANRVNVTTEEDTPVSIALPATDSDRDKLTYRILQDPLHGSLSGTAPELKYTPEPNFTGTDTFTFVVNDGATDSGLATVSITVTPVNDPPVAKDYDATAQEDKPLTIDLLGQCFDADNDVLSVASVTQGINGSVTINADSTLTYTPKANFYGTDKFTYTVEDSKEETDTATVSVAVMAVNDSPAITSVPPSKAKLGELYTYQVNAIDQDVNDALTYSLTTKPKDMSINPMSGLIRWTPAKAQLGTHEVAINVVDNYSTPASDGQSFTIIVEPGQLQTATLTVVDGYNKDSDSRLSAENNTHVVQSSDGKCWQTGAGSYTSYEFSDMFVPPGSTIRSVTVWVQHFEEEKFPSGTLTWNVGTGWPSNPVVWASWDAPVAAGKQNKRTDAWVHTGTLDTPKKVNSLQLQVANNDNITKSKTLVDHVYVVVEWY